VGRGGELPLSFGQQQLWLVAQMRPHSPYYNEPCGLRLRGRLRPAALAAALAEVVRRHEVLRTSFAGREGRPQPAVAGRVEVPLPVADLAALPAGVRRREAERQAAAAARRPFDLARPPLLRLLLLRLAPEEHLLVLVLHHIVHDGESFRVLAGELAALYGAFSCGAPSPLPPLAVQYADYAAWQRSSLDAATVERELAYWRGHLEGSEAVLELPADRPRPRQRSFRGGRVPLALPAAPLRAAGRRAGVTTFMVLLAAFYALLHRVSGQERINAGVPRSGRDRRETAGLLGFIVNTQVLSADLSGDPSFGELLRRVRAVALGGQAHPLLPFELLVRALAPARDAGVQPLFQAMLAFQEDPRQTLRLPGLELAPVDLFTGTCKFDLDLYLADAGASIEGYLDFAADLFEPATARRLLGHFRRLLRSAAAEPERRLSELSLLSAAERHQLLVEWDERGDEPRDRAVHQLFEAQAAAAPQRPALCADGLELTYGQLDARANRLAHHLVAAGLRPGEPVAVAVADAAGAVAALLAVLKAGGAFVYLDPGWPAGRCAAILAEVSPPLLIADPADPAAAAMLAALALAAPPDRLARLDVGGAPAAAAPRLVAADPPPGGQADADPRRPVDPEGPAYIAYTSGSTGRPRGIVQSHASFRQFLDWQSRRFGIAAGQRVAQWATLTYDAAYCEMFGALCHGATLCVAAPAVRHDPAALLDWLRRERVTLLQVVPSFMRQVLLAAAAPAGHPFPDLETVLLAGEVLPADLAAALRERCGDRPRLFNLYGPTETVLATWHAVGDRTAQQATVPIGRAIDGRQILVLDRAGRLCPLGVKGEIHVRSAHLTMGYFRRPEETARAFVQNPLAGPFPDPVYRTGDLGRWLPDGTLEFLGRADHQVKVRGMRVEPAEIEAALGRLPGIRECAVAAHDFAAGDRRLVAYVAAAPAAVCDPAALRAALRESLPAPLVPSIFMVLDALPRTATGKLDRAALPPPVARRGDPGAGFAPPRTAGEALVAECWRELLQIDRVGVDDDFFALGGHSLLAVQAVHRIALLAGVELAAQTLFEAPTVAAFAARLEAARTAAAVETATVRRLLERLQDLSDREVEALLDPQAAGRAAGGSQSLTGETT
jgi:amino acid adenylation domain-containing protein